MLPPTCLLCGAPGAEERDLCDACDRDLPRNRYACRRCAEPLVGQGSAILDALCGRCLRDPPAFDATIAPLLYQAPVDQLIIALKFQHRLSAARLLSGLLGDALTAITPLPQAIVPVPLHPQRMAERGFNQALELTRPLARRFGVAICADVVRRQRATPAQSLQTDFASRRRNVRGAFTLGGRPLPFRHVTLLDDVVTSASTVDEIARLLRQNGAESVQVWACARTSRTERRVIMGA